jgi:tRNA (guanine-N7-)-methyltransferase
MGLWAPNMEPRPTGRAGGEAAQESSEPMGSRARVRQHKNPLSFHAEVEIPDWEQTFARPELPMEVDVGSAHGDFIMAMAEAHPECNYVGLEIRDAMVDRVNARVRRLGLKNVLLVNCNANQSWGELFAPETLRRVYVHFPDPWFKKRHRKRRIMTDAFVLEVADALVPEGELRVMTDYEEYATSVVEQMRDHPRFRNAFGPDQPAPRDESFPLSHREEWHMSQGDSVHRYVWIRRAL